MVGAEFVWILYSAGSIFHLLVCKENRLEGTQLFTVPDISVLLRWLLLCVFQSFYTAFLCSYA
jgi:hypothetical protein